METLSCAPYMVWALAVAFPLCYHSAPGTKIGRLTAQNAKDGSLKDGVWQCCGAQRTEIGEAVRLSRLGSKFKMPLLCSVYIAVSASQVYLLFMREVERSEAEPRTKCISDIE